MANYKILVKAVIDENNIQKQLNNVSSKFKGIKIDTSGIKNTAKALHQLNNTASRTPQTFGDILKKITEFGSAAQIVYGVQRAFRDMAEGVVKSVLDMDSAMTEFQKVSEYSGETLENYIDKLGELGKDVARTSTEMLEAATLFKKTGASEEEAAGLAKIATMYQNIADEQISASDSAALITSQMKAFNIEAEDAIHVIDAINEV